MSRAVTLERVGLPTFEVPDARPVVPAEEYERRLTTLRERVEADAVVVYGDREHFANLAFFCGFDPRFEEALLVLCRGKPTLIVGREGLAYTRLVPPDVHVVLCPSLGLMGQERAGAGTLAQALAGAGVGAGNTVGIVGWKYLEPDEWDAEPAPIAAPAFVVDTIRHLAGRAGAVLDATRAVMNPVDGLRAVSSADQIAAFEWAAARASRAVARVLTAAKPGATEQETVSAMGYAGEPLSAHVMFSSGPEIAVGLRSATTRHLEQGDAATVAIGFWGGLCCRAGLVEPAEPRPGTHAAAYLERLAIPYWRAIATWYETVRLGVTGGEVDAAIRDVLAAEEFGSALNPGHLTHLDEWVHSPIRPGSADSLRSGMAFQCDIIPDNAGPGWAANCEDALVLTDEALRAEIARRHPDVWARMQERQRFMRERLGIALAEEILPLSSLPAYFPPFWLDLDYALVAS